MNIREYIFLCGENEQIAQELKTDYEEHVSLNVFGEFVRRLPKVPPVAELRNECPIWTDGVEILCATEWLAETVANILEAITGENEAHTGYYDPEEDARGNEVDDHTGWWYVDLD